MTRPTTVRTDEFEAQLRAAIVLTRRLSSDPLHADDLGAALYHGWYARPVSPVLTLDSSRPPLPGLLRAAHAGSDRWQSGWRTLRTDRYGVVVAWQDGLSPQALPRGCYTHATGAADASDRAGLLPRPGERLMVVDRRDSLGTDGWWRTWSETWDPHHPPTEQVVRLYFSLRTEHLAQATHEITATLLDAAEPWLLKIALDPAALRRPDVAVLYLPAESLKRLSPPLFRLVRRLRPALRRGVPPLTHRIAPGVATAAEPGDGLSFGEHRCAAIARALTSVRASWAPLSTIADAFADAGIDPARPYRPSTWSVASQWI
jgi:hypothetical protein